jgi:acetyltransferase-like isoleucine patch superfamily enzyme
VFPFKINGAKFVSIGKKVHINEGAWIMALKNSKKDPVINIGDGSYIGRFVHIVSINKIEICDNVAMADKVYITDNAHNYEDINTLMKEQEILDFGPVVIGENTWLGENACIMGASIGKHCVIGVNAVVTTDIPDYSIAVGSPARVIKQYNFNTKKWEKK